MFSVYVNKDAYDKLPKEYKEAIRIAAADSNVRMVAHYDYLNPIALDKLLEKGVKLRKFSDEIMSAAQENAFEMYEQIASDNPTWAKVYRQWKKFRDSQYAWHGTNELGYADFALPRVDTSRVGAGQGD